MANCPVRKSPLAGYASAAAPAFVGRGGVISAGRLAASAHSLAAGLPAAGCVLNLCEDRFHFVAGLLAAMERGLLSLFPATVNPFTVDQLRERYGDCLLLRDSDPDPRLPEGDQLDIRPWCTAAPAGATAELAAVPPQREVAVVFTSGSTGEPRPHVKTWADLAGVGDHIGAMLTGGLTPLIVATVPTQHMYGLEATVMTPLRHGLPVHRERPFYPLDVDRCLGDAGAMGGRSVLVTTPLHLRACLRAGGITHPPALVFSATAPLGADLVAACERDWGSEVQEIFGCTEVGSIAHRRPAESEVWTVFHDIVLRRVGDDEGTLTTTRSIREFAFNDHVEVLDEQHFRLLGRKEDVINQAGKRASLAALNHALLAIDGVDDGCFLQPADGARLVAFVVARELDQDGIRRCLGARIDAAFLPRRVFFVPALPRNATGKLPRAALAALHERLSRGRVEGELCIPADHPALSGHFPGRPVVPGVVLLDELEALWRSAGGPQVVEIVQAKFLCPLLPEVRVRGRFEVNGEDPQRVQVRVEDAWGEPCFVGQFRCAGVDD